MLVPTGGILGPLADSALRQRGALGGGLGRVNTGGGDLPTPRPTDNIWIRITGLSIPGTQGDVGNAAYAWNFVTRSGVTIKDLTERHGSAVTFLPAYELNNYSNVPFGSVVRAWIGGDCAAPGLEFVYDQSDCCVDGGGGPPPPGPCKPICQTNVDCMRIDFVDPDGIRRSVLMRNVSVDARHPCYWQYETPGGFQQTEPGSRFHIVASAGGGSTDGADASTLFVQVLFYTPQNLALFCSLYYQTCASWYGRGDFPLGQLTTDCPTAFVIRVYPAPGECGIGGVPPAKTPAISSGGSATKTAGILGGPLGGTLGQSPNYSGSTSSCGCNGTAGACSCNNPVANAMPQALATSRFGTALGSALDGTPPTWTDIENIGTSGGAASVIVGDGNGGLTYITLSSGQVVGYSGGAVAAVSAGSSAVTPLFSHYTDAANSGSGETDLYSDTVAAGQLSANGQKIEATYAGVIAGTAIATPRVYFGGTSIFDSGSFSAGLTDTPFEIRVTIIRKDASTVRCSVSITGLNLSDKYTEVGSLTLSNTQVLKITGQSSASNNITAKLGSVWHTTAP